MLKLWKWIVLLAVIAAVEVIVRFAVPFHLQRVLVTEAVAFLTASLVGSLLASRSVQTGWRLGLQWILTAGFLLGALRAALWAGGMQVVRANQIIAGLAVLALVIWFARSRASRRNARRSAQAGDF